jgi:NAD-dependent DNA ligase
LEVPKLEKQESSQSSSVLSYSAFVSKSKEETKQKDPKTALRGLKFAVTGEFDAITRDQIEQIIKNHGGDFVTGVSGKITHLLVGRILTTGQPPETSKKYSDA